MIDIAALFIAYLLSQFYRSFMAVLSPVLIEDLGVDAAALASVSGVWFLAFAAAQIPTGMALDRFGPRRTTGAALLIGGGGGALVFAAAQGPGLLTAGMTLIGVGCAPILMSGLFLFARRHAPARFATLSGLMIGFGSLGNVLGAAPLALAVEAVGWRAAMVGLAAVAAALAAMILTLVRDPPRLEGAGGAGFGGLAELLRIRALWPILPLAMCNYSVSAGLRGLWLGPYLADVHGFAPAAVGGAALWMALAMTAGNFVYGPLDRVFGTRKWLLVVGNGAGMACTLWLALSVPSPKTAVGLLTAIGFLGASYAVMLAHVRSFVPAHLTGRGVTMANVFGIGGVALGQFASGAVFEATLNAGATKGEAHDAVFLYYGLTLAAALLIYLRSRDSRP